MENAVIQRIIEISALKEKSHRSFAISIGFNYKTLNNYIIGERTTIDSLLIQRIASTYEDISLDWLLVGKGEMLKSSSSDSSLLEEMKEEIISLKSENKALREVIGLGERKDSVSKSA